MNVYESNGKNRGERWNERMKMKKNEDGMKIFLPLHEWKHSLFVLYDTKVDHWHEVRSMLLNDLLSWSTRHFVLLVY